MIKFLSLLLLLFGVFVDVHVHGQVISRVQVIEYRQYMTDVISEVMKRVEGQGWWNLLVPDLDNDYDENFITWDLKGNVKYSNGFVDSIQKISILQSSLQQVWSSTNGVRVEIRGKLRLEDLAIGVDIVSDLADGVHHHTGLMTYPLATFDFSIFRDAFTHEMTVTVSGSLDRTSNEIEILPMDKLADALIALFDMTTYQPGISSWGPAVFQPLAEDIVKTEAIKFPGLCYDCPAS